MQRTSHIAQLAELSETEGVFTTAQAARMGIPRDCLSGAVASGRLERVARGAYRLRGSQSAWTDELAAVWKLTAPGLFTHERSLPGAWDGVTVGGATAACVLGMGDFQLSPYRLYAPRRFNTRNREARFSVKRVGRQDVTFQHGFPVTRPERTILDLALDGEDPSLVAHAANVGLSQGCLNPGRLTATLRDCLPAAEAEHLLGEIGMAST